MKNYFEFSNDANTFTLTGNIPVTDDATKKMGNTPKTRFAPNSKMFKNGLTGVYPTRVKTAYFCKKHLVVYVNLETTANGVKYKHKSRLSNILQQSDIDGWQNVDKTFTNMIIKRIIKTPTKYPVMVSVAKTKTETVK